MKNKLNLNFRRITFILAMLAMVLLDVSAAESYAKITKIDLSITNSTVKEVLKEIENKSEFVFFYNDKAIKANRVVNVNVKSVGIEDILRQILPDCNFRIDNRKIIITPKAQNEVTITNATQQSKKLIGKVVDAATNEPMIGVAISVKGTTRGTITDTDGNFSIEVSRNNRLEIAYLGYITQQVVFNGQATLNISLVEDTQKLNEVVVTATGIKRENKAIGYAIAEVKGSDLVQRNQINPVSSLQGVAPGVSVQGSGDGIFGSSKIQIRGISTLNGSNTQPIFVVDGIILNNDAFDNSQTINRASNDFGNQLKNLNVEDFESVTILKGAASTALYGSRGLNGAVVITTKNPTKQKGLGITFSQTLGVDWVYDTPDMQVEFGPGARAGNRDYASGQNRFADNFAYENGQGTIRDGGVMGWNFGPSFKDNPNVNVIGYDGKVIPYRPFKNYYKDAYDTGFNTTSNLSIQGGNDKTHFYLSDSYTNRKGTFPGNKFEKNSVFFKGDHALSNFLRADASINVNYSKSINPPFDIGQYFCWESINNMYNTKYYKNKWHTVHGGYPQSAYGDEFGGVPNMDFWFKLNNNHQQQNQMLILPIVKLTANILPELTLVGEWNMSYLNTEYETKQLGWGYHNQGSDNNSGGYYYTKQVIRMQNTAKTSLAYRKKFNDFDFNGLVAGEWFFDRGDHAQSQNTNGGLIVPGLYFIGNSKNLASYSSSITGKKNIYSAYFSIGGSWKDQLYLDITGRNDWSTALVYSNGTGNNSYFYPSVSGSWLFSETFKLPSWISFGKLRASWAQVGNDTEAYRINQAYSIGNIQTANGLVYTNTFDKTMVSPNLKPERKNSFEVGADIRFLKGRIGLDATYYKENTKDQIMTITAPKESGITSQLINAGNVQNKGLEIALKTTPVQTKDFRWDMTLNWNKNWNKIVRLHKDVGDYLTLNGELYGSMQVASVAYIGGEYGTLVSAYAPKRYNTTNASDARNGKMALQWVDSYKAALPIRSQNVEKVGSISPKFEGSIVNEFNIKNFWFNCLIDYRFGGYIVSFTNRYGTNAGYMKQATYAMDEKHGGLSWTSKYSENAGLTFHDGIIPDGVFQDGQTATGPDGVSHDLSGLTYKDAVDKGYIEPTHASYWTERTHSWSQGVVTDDWCSEVKYICLRHVSVGYQIPNKLTSKWKISGLRISLDAQNLYYLYNSLPDHLNPESFMGNSNTYSYNEIMFSPYVASYALTIKFNM